MAGPIHPHPGVPRKGSTAERLRSITRRLDARLDPEAAEAPGQEQVMQRATHAASARIGETDMTQTAIAGPFKYCPGCAMALHISAVACPQCGAAQPGASGQRGTSGRKSRVSAIVLALLLGGIGAHKFYLGRVGAGIIYLLFCWTLIPGLLGLIEGVIYATMDDAAFAEKYG